jgi:hypothetical protein
MKAHITPIYKLAEKMMKETKKEKKMNTQRRSDTVAQEGPIFGTGYEEILAKYWQLSAPQRLRLRNEIGTLDYIPVQKKSAPRLTRIWKAFYTWILKQIWVITVCVLVSIIAAVIWYFVSLFYVTIIHLLIPHLQKFYELSWVR